VEIWPWQNSAKASMACIQLLGGIWTARNFAEKIPRSACTDCSSKPIYWISQAGIQTACISRYQQYAVTLFCMADIARRLHALPLHSAPALKAAKHIINSPIYINYL